MQVHDEFDFDLVSIIPKADSLSAITELQHSNSVLEAFSKAADVLSSIRESESTVSVHLIVKEITHINSSVHRRL